MHKKILNIIIFTLIFIIFIMLSYNIISNSKQKPDLATHPTVQKTAVHTKVRMIVSGHPAYPPIMWQKKNSIKGVGANIVATFCKELNIPYKIKYVGPWERVQQDAKSGKIDLILGIYKNPQREKYLSYTIPYITDPTSIATLKNKLFKYNKKEDLIAQKGITMHGDSFGEELDNFIKEKLNIKRAYTSKAIFKNLENGRVDYIIWGYYPILTNANKLNYHNKIKIFPTPIITENMYMAFAKNSPFRHYKKQINTIIARLKKNGKIKQWANESLSEYNQKNVKTNSKQD